MKSLWLKTSAITASFSVLMGLSLTASAATTKAKAKASKTSASSTVSASVAQAPSTMTAKKKLPISISDWSTFYGPLVNDISTGKTSDSAIDAQTGLSSRHQVSFKYAINDTLSVAPVADFKIQHTVLPGEEKGFTLKDPFLKIAKNDLLTAKIRGNDIHLDSQLRLYAPASKSSRTNKTNGSAALWLSPTVNFAKSKFSLTVYNYARHFFQSQTFSPSGSLLTADEVYTGPQLSYGFTDKVSAFVLYEAAMTFNTLGQPQSSTSPNDSLTDLEPGMSLDVTPNISLIPFLNWYTNQPMATTSINLSASIKLL